jgi:predicted metalloprotease with PDZ domain
MHTALSATRRGLPGLSWLTTGLVMLAPILFGKELQAQARGQKAVVAQSASPGRLGVRLLSRREFTVGSDEAPRTVVLIEEVLVGGAAARAGMRAGDVVVQINGMFPSEALLMQLGPDLKAGDSLRLSVRRGRESMDRWVVADARPVDQFAPRSPMALPREADARRWPLGLRTARAEEEAEGFTIVWQSSPGQNQSLSYSFQPAEQGDLPFNAFVVRTPKTDSLMSLIHIVRGQIKERAWGPDDAQSVLRVELSEELGALQHELATVSSERLRLSGMSQETGEVRVRVAPSRALAPLMQTGRAFLLGAEVTSVNDELGKYFEVESGVLVSSVPVGTPADRFGLRAGDVIVATHLGPVEDFQQLRAFLYRYSLIELTVVRRGERLLLRSPESR